jgi:3',5'-cyclic AMP phosphodiesterase CpdA
MSDTPLFSFAAIADTHLNPEGAENTSPWRTNRLANARNAYLVEQLNRIKLAFVVHIGDIVHPVPSNPLFAPAADFAKRLFGRLSCPLHVLPGNHDVGDKPLDWMPADRVTAEAVRNYRATFGPDWGAFDHGGCRFVRINSSLLNSGLPDEAEQKAWLESELASVAGRRIFLFVHYPPFVARADEESHYDNLDEPARSWLLDLLTGHRVEALFAGHVHNFFYNRHGATRCYVLPSVTSLRQDYAEFFRIEPAEEYGRNDAAKLGFLIVDVYPDRHSARFVRTDGETDSAKLLTFRENVPSPVGVHLRHAWAEEIELPYNGPLDELSRKRVRNDYSLLALWDLGIMHLRVPLSDLKNDRVRARMADLCDLGRRFTVFSFGTPDPATCALMRAHRQLVDRWELILPLSSSPDAMDVLGPLRAELPAVFLTKLHGQNSAKQDPGKPFDHSIAIGFDPNDDDDLCNWWSTGQRVFSGAGFTVRPGMPITASIGSIAKLSEGLNLRAMISVKLGPAKSAAASPTEASVVGDVAEAITCAWSNSRLAVFLDTFQTIDRGYFVRPGLIDRRCNPTLAGKAFRELQIELARRPKASSVY